MATYKGKNTFAIIGAQDKDTLEDRRDELISKVSEMSQKNRGKIGYMYLFGRYEYENGELAEELSIMIIGITKEKAISICKELNQELIIWRDDNFFGFLDCNGNESGEFTTNEKNMSFSDEDIELMGSRLAKHKNKNQLKWFKFVLERFVPIKSNSIKNMGYKKDSKREKETIFELYVRK